MLRPVDASTSNCVAWQDAARRRGLIPQLHGGALMPGGGYRPGAGRPKSRVKAALEQARGDPLRQARLLGQFARDESLSVGELCRAASYLFDLLRRLEREAGKAKRPRQRVRLGPFGIRRTAA